MNITHQKYIMLRLSVVTYRPDIGFKLHGSYQSHTLLQSYASMHPANKISDHIKKRNVFGEKISCCVAISCSLGFRKKQSVSRNTKRRWIRWAESPSTWKGI